MRVVSREDVETMFQDTSDHHKVDMILHTISDEQLPSLLFIIMEHGLVTGLKSSTLILLESIYLKAFYFQGIKSYITFCYFHYRFQCILMVNSRSRYRLLDPWILLFHSNREKILGFLIILPLE